MGVLEEIKSGCKDRHFDRYRGHPDSGDLHVSVKDTGKGIDAEIYGKLFQKFVTKSDRAKGTGLGLYLSKAVVEAHGGKMGAENNKAGKGATFSFSLPASS